MTSNQNTSTKVIRNTFFGTAGYLWGLVISLLLTPFIVSRIGVAGYGLFILIESIFGLFSLLDIAGISGAFVKFIAEAHAKRDHERINRLVVLGVSYYSAFSLIVCCLACIFHEPILKLFRIPVADQAVADFVFYGILFSSFLQGSLGVFRSVLLGMQRLDITNIISMLIGLANGIAIAVVLVLGYGLPGLIVVSVAIAFVAQVAQIGFAFHVLPSLKRMRPFLDRELFHETFKYGMQIQVGKISEIVTARINKFLIGRFLTIDLVGFYELGSKIAAVAQSPASQLMGAIVPAASELEAQGGREPVLKLYYRTSKYAALIAIPMTAFVCAFPAAILMFWMGKGTFGMSALALQVLAAGTLLATIAAAGRLVARGMGFPSYEMQSCILTTVLNVIFSTVLLIRYGFVGALLGTALSSTIGAFYFLYFYHKKIREGLFAILFVRYFGPPTLASLAAVGVTLAAANSLHEVAASRSDAALTLGITGAIFIAVYSSVLFAVRYIDRVDIETGRRIVTLVRNMFPGRKTA